VTARRAKRENGGLGEAPPGGYDDLLTGPLDLDVQHWQFERSERGGLGVSPRKVDSWHIARSVFRAVWSASLSFILGVREKRAKAPWLQRKSVI
jgi:hypothetical protein